MYHPSRMIDLQTSAFLFDMDGVLINSIPAVTRVWSGWALEHGLDPAYVVPRAHGRPSIETLRDILPGANHEKENLEVERREIADVEGIVPLPGVCKLLEALPLDRWAIVTSCTRDLAAVRVKAAGLPKPGLLITCDDITNGKPHPEPYLKAAKALGFDPAECVVVEDAPAGIRSGRAAGSRVIGLRTTMLEADLLKAQPSWIVDNCAAIQLRSANGTGPVSFSLEIDREN